MRNFLVLVVVLAVLVFAQSAPVVTKVPSGLQSGDVVGSGFGSKPGHVWVKPIAKVTEKTKAQGVDDGNCDRLLSQNVYQNRIEIPVGAWTASKISVKAVPSSFVSDINEKRSMNLALSDFNFVWQVEAENGNSSEWK